MSHLDKKVINVLRRQFFQLYKKDFSKKILIISCLSYEQNNLLIRINTDKIDKYTIRFNVKTVRKKTDSKSASHIIILL